MQRINGFFQLKTCPNYIICTGPRGCGKKYFIEQVCKHYGIRPIWFGYKAEEIRSIVDNAKALTEPTMYIMADCDNMSVAAKNILLKTTEEPNNNVYIAMTLESENNTLPTLISRGYKYEIPAWSLEEISEVCKEKNWEVRNDILDIATNPGEYGELQGCFDELTQYCVKVMDMIDTVTSANSFNIAKKISFKDGEEGFSMELFLKVFQKMCVQSMIECESKQDVLDYWIMVGCAHSALLSMRNRSYSKKNLFDKFIIDTRAALLGGK